MSFIFKWLLIDPVVDFRNSFFLILFFNRVRFYRYTRLAYLNPNFAEKLEALLVVQMGDHLQLVVFRMEGFWQPIDFIVGPNGSDQ